jgi:hypothetical protein
VVEEEVDIGDDVPDKEFPPVVIEKDKVVHPNVSSSSSSSSGSGSSSSGKFDYNLVYENSSHGLASVLVDKEVLVITIAFDSFCL